VRRTYLKLYRVKDDYINYLRVFESKVLDNKNEKRPYVGVVYSVNSMNYYIPLASPKEKFNRMNNSKDFHKIEGGQYGALNFNNMIPVKDDNLIKIDINNEPDKKYKALLINQYMSLLDLTSVISRKSVGIYNLYIATEGLTPNDKKIKDRCCNFPLLEEKCMVYNNSGC
jgi:protein AbiQ